MALRRAYLYRDYSFIVPFLLLWKPSEINRTMHSWISSKAKFYFKKKRESILFVCVYFNSVLCNETRVYHDFQSASVSLSYATVLMCHLTPLLFNL